MIGSLTVWSYIKSVKSFDRYCTPHILMLLSLWAQVVASLFNFFHLRKYAENGKGHEILEIFSKVSQAMAEIVMSLFIIMMANGWTILFQDFEVDSHLELAVPAVALVVIIHILCAALTYVDIDASHKYHDMAGTEGWVLFFTKLLIFAYFCHISLKTAKKLDRKTQQYFKL